VAAGAGRPDLTSRTPEGGPTGCDHGHAAGTATGGRRLRLAVVLGLTVAVATAEVVVAVLSASLALLADAGHMATDAVGIALALTAVTLAQRPARGRRTFGWQRAEILAAVANGLLLLGVAGYVLVEAVRRIGSPPEIAPGPVLAVGAVGLVVNLVSLAVLHQGRGESLDLRGAYLEVLADGWTPADTVASLAIGVLVLPRAWQLLREALDVLLEAAPARPARVDDHLRAGGALGARRRHRRGARGRARRAGARRAVLVPRVPLRRGALHVPAGGPLARRPRGAGPRLEAPPRARPRVGQWEEQ